MYTSFIIRDRAENPVNIFYDDPADLPKDYIPRIKFQLDYEYLPNLENTGEMKLVDKPEIMCGDTSNLKKEDIQKLKKWVKKYRKTIFKWQGAKDDCPLPERLDWIKHKEIKPENEDWLYDPCWPMAPVWRFSKGTNFGLPDELKVYIDDSDEYSSRMKKNQSYIPRIKFVGNPEEEDELFWIYVPMSIEDEPRLLMPEMRHNISNENIEILKNWVKRYKEQLLKVTREEIWWGDFLHDIKANHTNEKIVQEDGDSFENFLCNSFPKIKERWGKNNDTISYEDIKAKIKEDLLKLDFVEVPEFKGEKTNGNLYQRKWEEEVEYSAFFNENGIRLQKEDTKKYREIDYSCYKEFMDDEMNKTENITPKLAGFGMIVFSMLELDGITL